jgi:hypothetical protein
MGEKFIGEYNFCIPNIFNSKGKINCIQKIRMKEIDKKFGLIINFRLFLFLILLFICK